MVADSPVGVTDREATIHFYDFRSRKTCAYCSLPINWMYTRFGSQLPFDAELLPRDLDPQHDGWLPGPWQVKGRRRMVMAPMRHYGRRKRERVTHVASLHQCPQRVLAHELGLTGAIRTQVVT